MAITADQLVKLGMPAVLADYLTTEYNAIQNATIGTRLDNLETAVGGSGSGLVKSVNDLDTRVTALENPT